MDFSRIVLDDATVAFWDELRAWLDDHWSEEMVEYEWRTGEGHNPAFHRALGAKGWAFPGLPVEEGGAELSPEQSRILALELTGRHVPTLGRDLTGMVLPAIRRWMTPPVRDDLVRRAAQGEVCFCLGYTEPEAGSDLASIRTRAVRDGDEWIITGQKMFTTGAQYCDFAFLVARTDLVVPKHKGLTMFLVPLDAPGLEIQDVKTLGGERTNMVFFDGVRVPDHYRVGPEGHGWAVIHGPLNAEHRMSEHGPQPVEEEPGEAGMGAGADMSARMLQVHEPAVLAAVEWARTPGPDGRRPIDDPTVRQRLAEVELGLIVSKLTPGPHGRVVSADLLIRNSSELLDLVGPYGLVSHGEATSIGAGWIEYAHRFAQGTAIYGGTTEVIRNLIAEHFLALPRSRPAP